jgi:hypothetical protein
MLQALTFAARASKYELSGARKPDSMEPDHANNFYGDP